MKTTTTAAVWVGAVVPMQLGLALAGTDSRAVQGGPVASVPLGQPLTGTDSKAVQGVVASVPLGQNPQCPGVIIPPLHQGTHILRNT